jgi:DNA ligase-4
MANARKERGEMKRSLQKLLRSTSALEQKWLIRIIMRDLKIGLSETSVLGVYHPDAVDLFTVCSSLEKVSRDLHSLQTHLNEASISLSTPFRPMLGQRASFDQVGFKLIIGRSCDQVGRSCDWVIWPCGQVM